MIIAVVFAALALFGLKVWSDRTNEDQLTSGGRVVGDMARLGGGDRESDDYGGGGAANGPGGARNGRTAGRLGDRNPLRPGAGGRADGEAGVIGGAGRAGSFGRGGGAGGVAGSGGSMGVAGSSGGTIAGGERGGEAGQQKARKNDLVDFLSSQPATAPELDKPEGEEGVALKLESTDDITKQGGVDKDVADSQDGEGIEIPEDGKIQFPNNVSPDAAAFEFTIKPNWSGSDQTDNALVQLRGEHEWSNRIELVKNGEFLRFILTDNTGKESDISYRITDWQAGDAHDLRAEYGPCDNSPSNCTRLYIDDRKVGEKEYQGGLNIPPNTPLFVGGDYEHSSYGGANAHFTGFKITNKTL